MAVNSSSNDSLPPKVPLDLDDCFFTGPTSFIFISFSITNILLLLPLCILIIYLGLQRWRQQRSTSSAATVTSHSDVFTYHTVVMELIEVLGCIISFCGVYAHDVGFNLWVFSWYGETFFHILTCLERYLAVVHPVTYLSLRGERGIRLRNISIVCVWLLSCVMTFMKTVKEVSISMYFGFMILSLIIISFCSLSVLLVLIRPGPGEQGGDRGRVDQSKRRAFYTILAILGVLMLRFGGNLVIYIVYVSDFNMTCVLTMSQVWFNFPSSLVLPLLFLHKAGTFVCLKKSTK